MSGPDVGEHRTPPPAYASLRRAIYAADTAALRVVVGDNVAARAEVRAARAALDNASACLEALTADEVKS